MMASVLTLTSVRAIVGACIVTGARSSDEEFCMLQTPQLRGGEDHIGSDNSAESCTPLVNHGTFSTMEIAVGTPIPGTPAQTFQVVADTGSDSIIVQSCVCQQMQNCNRGDHCFLGTDHSSSFHVHQSSAGVPGAIITFGSGPIQVAVSSDVVCIGQGVGRVCHEMVDSLLLMVDLDLDFDGPFEGILGLGLPSAEREVASPSGLEGMVQQIIGASGGHTSVLAEGRSLQAHNVSRAHTAASGDSPLREPAGDLALFGAAAEKGLVSRHRGATGATISAQDRVYDDTSFMEQAGVGRFSMCFNDDLTNGALRLNPTPAATLDNVGHDHWALDFRGVSVGDSAVGFCQHTTSRGQATPCAAVPDSGTTAIMGPQEHIDALFESLCEGWGRCSTRALQRGESKSEAFVNTLHDCNSWLGQHAQGLLEVPSLSFHVRDADEERVLEIPPWAYVVARTEGWGHQVCEAQLNAIDYTTTQNGPVWIFGTPFFYAYKIGFDLETAGISFTSTADSPCGTCDSSGSLFSGSASVSSAEKRRRQPRRVSRPNRGTSIDTGKPL